eukprot:GHRQ01025747.1.p1 GENE.GHRQ01025747.1~~GHRQ01025747.1.p1  ORF type:complete len:265 (-),score=36.97 GHRQ01025747.1:257-1051(-)
MRWLTFITARCCIRCTHCLISRTCTSTWLLLLPQRRYGCLSQLVWVINEQAVEQVSTVTSLPHDLHVRGDPPLPLDVCDDAAQLALRRRRERQLGWCPGPEHHDYQDERVQQQDVGRLLALRHSACQRQRCLRCLGVLCCCISAVSSCTRSSTRCCLRCRCDRFASCCCCRLSQLRPLEAVPAQGQPLSNECVGVCEGAETCKDSRQAPMQCSRASDSHTQRRTSHCTSGTLAASRGAAQLRLAVTKHGMATSRLPLSLKQTPM